MQLSALDHQQKIVFAPEATKHQDYWCIECQSAVRLRGGLHKQTHFYHTDTQRVCRQNKKSMAHLHAQYFLQNLFSPDECLLEHRFSSIQRIADVLWVSQKIVFEIQCSPISLEEVRMRSRDYASLGYQVIWILHDQRYNQKRLSAAEFFLQPYPHYFTNINGLGEGEIYDQMQRVVKGRREWTGERWPVNLRKLYRLEKKKIPRPLQNLRQLWPFYFEGDLMERLLSGKQEDTPPFLLNEKTVSVRSFSGLGRQLLKPFRLIFQLLLERACQ